MKLKLTLASLAFAFAMGGPALAADKIKIGYITKFPAPYFQTMEDAAKAWAKDHPNVEIVYGQGTSATDIEGQIALIEKMVAQGVQGIAITPVDPSVSTTLDKVVAGGVKVVLMDNSIPDWKNQTALATTDNFAAGKLAGAFLKSKLKDGDKVGILEAVPGVPALDDRVNGMMEGLKGVSVDIVGKGATSCDQEKGLNLAQDILTANPDVKAFYSACGAPAVGAAQAIKNANLDHHIIVVGFDFCCGEDGPDGTIATGEEDATVAQFPAKMSELGVDALVKALNGEQVESLIDSGAALVTKENLKDFM
ncbi:MAG: sugar ABC transporter substrate-binding protein [Salaquimonas sp.]|nr:sugar ABC transporter substrate-binding protein [Salaquimonas sp.]